MTMPGSWPAYEVGADGKRHWTRGGQAWAAGAPRDRNGRFKPRKKLSPEAEQERLRRLEREAQVRRDMAERRSAFARRARVIEQGLRHQLKRQGRIIRLHDELYCRQAAVLATRLELLKGEAEAGHPVDDERMIRCANALQRTMAKLNLRPDMLDGGERPRGEFSRSRWDAQEKAAPQTAHPLGGLDDAGT